ncbi:hypothetical protein D3C76_1494250 [compost metagenome]
MKSGAQLPGEQLHPQHHIGGNSAYRPQHCHTLQTLEEEHTQNDSCQQKKQAAGGKAAYTGKKPGHLDDVKQMPLQGEISGEWPTDGPLFA